jgi:hypothetical protein
VFTWHKADAAHAGAVVAHHEHAPDQGKGSASRRGTSAEALGDKGIGRYARKAILSALCGLAREYFPMARG